MTRTSQDADERLLPPAPTMPLPRRPQDGRTPAERAQDASAAPFPPLALAWGSPEAVELDGIAITEQRLAEWERARVFCAARGIRIGEACRLARLALDKAGAR